MKNLFIELTDSDGVNIMLNVMHIAWIEPAKDGTAIKSNLVHYSGSKKVKESYQEVKAKIESLNE